MACILPAVSGEGPIKQGAELGASKLTRDNLGDLPRKAAQKEGEAQ